MATFAAFGHLVKSPILPLACCFAAGILAAHKSPPFSAVLPLVICGVCLLAGSASWHRGWQTAAGLIALAGFVFAGASAARLFAFRFSPNDISHLTDRDIGSNRPVRLDGRLLTTPLRTPYGLQFDLEVRRFDDNLSCNPVTGKIRLYLINGRKSGIAAASLRLHDGDLVSLRARLQRPRNYANPGGFDYRKWLQSVQDISWQGSIEDPAWIRKVSTGRRQAGSAQLIVERVRQRLLMSIDRLYPPWTLAGRDGAVLKAILLGDRSSLDSSTIEDFRKTGLYHLLVVAGLHVGLLAMLIELLLRLLRVRSTWRAALLLLILGFYASLVEQRAPTLRASLMIGVYLVARLLDRDQPVLNAVGLAGLILLADRPGWLFDAGFQLSFSAALLIAGLALPILERTTEPYRRALWHLDQSVLDREFAPHQAQFRLDVRDTSEWLAGRWRYLRSHPALAGNITVATLKAGIWFAELFILSAVLQFGLLLPMVEIFHRVTLAGIGLNLLAIPCMTILLAIAVPTVVLNAIVPPLALLPSKFLTFTLNGLFALTELPRLPHWLSYRIPTPPDWVAWGFIICLVMAACALALNRRIFWLSLFGVAAFAALLCLQPFRPRIPQGVLEITQLDCGGGEASFIVLPDQTTMLASACGGRRRRISGGDPLRARRWDPGENIVSPYLWSRGIKAIDIFLLPDTGGDYLSGVASVLRNFRVKAFWCPRMPPEPYSAALVEMLHKRGVRVQLLEAGDTLTRGKTCVSILGSSAIQVDTRRRRGEPSLIRITTTEGATLLAGNFSLSTSESGFGSKLGVRPGVVQATGRGESSGDFAQVASQLHPRLVLIDSAAAGGHDVQDNTWLSQLPTAQIRALSVAADGAVTLRMHDEALSLHCFRGACH